LIYPILEEEEQQLDYQYGLQIAAAAGLPQD
jgi:hypothetical protein